MNLPRAPEDKPMNQFDIMKTPFLLFQSHFNDYYNMSQDSLAGLQQQESILSKVFFSPQNVDIVQKQIILEVFRRTNGAYWIEKQEEKDLQIIMRSMFIQHARHVPDDIKGQIKELNNIVVDDIVPNVISQVNAYFGYLERAFAPRQIMDRPECVSIAGTKTLPSVTRTFDARNEIQTSRYQDY
uniref:Minor capsid protein P8 central region domain-containing protein n=1 Tax=viral metagenome TaxID=1070528 RepID=A0A6C0LQH8_9ZZZZ